MNHMNFIVWMLPVIFMLHDFEEIIMAEVWGKRYHERINRIWPKRQPFGLKYVKEYPTPALALGVNVEFLLFSMVSWLSAVFNSYYVWYGCMMGFIFHLIFVHIILCIPFKGYVPGVITTVIFLIPSIYYAFVSAELLQLNSLTFFLSLIGGILLLLTLLPILHKLFGPWSNWLYHYSKKSA